jgi:acyl-CoA hydrolase
VINGVDGSGDFARAAYLRALSPRERAKEIIEKCASPRKSLRRGSKIAKPTQIISKGSSSIQPSYKDEIKAMIASRPF